MRDQRTAKMAKMAMLAAISIVLVFLVHFPIVPAVPFLEYDPADVSVLIGAFAFGPVAGIVITVIASIIQGFTVSAQGGIFGIIMHILATGTLVLVAGNIYRVKKTIKGAILALLAGALSMVAVMAIANIILNPIFYGMPREAVYALLPAIITFNLAKAGINSVITLLVYKRISKFLHR